LRASFDRNHRARIIGILLSGLPRATVTIVLQQRIRGVVAEDLRCCLSTRRSCKACPFPRLILTSCTTGSVHSRTSDTIDHLLAALRALDARYRTTGAREIEPERSHLSSPDHQVLMTKFGPLLARSHREREGIRETAGPDGYNEVGTDRSVRVLHLAALIKVKEEVAHDKGRAALAVLRRTLEEKSKS